MSRSKDPQREVVVLTLTTRQSPLGVAPAASSENTGFSCNPGSRSLC